MPKISVIIPVYNVEKYLRECLDSVINQTLKDIEIILVDDGSTDSSLSICEEYAQKDSRIIVLSQKNQGAAVARNKGIEMATGDYLSILDSDDYFNEAFLEKMYKKALSTDVEVVICRSRSLDSRNDEIKNMDYSINVEYLPSKAVFNSKDIPIYIFELCVGWSWDKIFKREFVNKNNLSFQNLRSTNDAYFVFIALVLAKNITLVEDVLITHRINRKNQLSMSREKDPLCFLDAIYFIKNKLCCLGLYENYEQSFLNWVLKFCIWQVSTLNKKTQKLVIGVLKDDAFVNLKIFEKPISYFFGRVNLKYFFELFPSPKIYKNFFEYVFSIKELFNYQLFTICGMKIGVKKR